MKEPALQKTDQDVVGRLVIMKMSGEFGHLLRSSSFIVYKTLQRDEQWRAFSSASLYNIKGEWVHTCHSYYYRNFLLFYGNFLCYLLCILYHMLDHEHDERSDKRLEGEGRGGRGEGDGVGEGEGEDPI